MKPISSFKKQKNELSIILLTSIAFALGINLISSFTSVFEQYQKFLLIVGILLISASIVFIFKILWAGMKTTLRVEGALAISIEDQRIIKKEIMGYRFNDDVFEYLNSFLNENQAYKKLFINTSKNDIYKATRFNPDEINFHSIINSVIELVYLSQLSRHLNTYFVKNEIDDNRITVLSRKDLDAAVLKNRVLDLITRDMKERAAFIDQHGDGVDEAGIVFYAQGNDGAIYERFELELPPKSTIRRNQQGFLEIENKLFKLTFRPRFEGFATNIPDELLSSSGDFYPYLASASLDILIKQTIFLSDTEIEIYAWLDSFLERLDFYVTLDKLEKSINLEMVRLLHTLLEEKREGSPSSGT